MKKIRPPCQVLIISRLRVVAFVPVVLLLLPEYNRMIALLHIHLGFMGHCLFNSLNE